MTESKSLTKILSVSKSSIAILSKYDGSPPQESKLDFLGAERASFSFKSGLTTSPSPGPEFLFGLEKLAFSIGYGMEFLRELLAELYPVDVEVKLIR